MQTIQVVMEEQLLRAADRVVKSKRTNRSALIREALKEHLRRLHVRELEEQERRAYEKQPQDLAEIAAWEREAVWPD